VGAGATLYYPFQGVPSGTYQFAATWIVIPGLSTQAQFLIQDQNGATLATFTVDQTVAPGDFTQHGVAWKTIGSYTIPPYSPINGLTLAITNVGTSGNVSADAVQLNRTSVDDSIAIKPTDTVTLSVPAGCITTTAGAVAAVSGQTVTNLVGGSLLPPFSAVPKTLELGYNIEPESPGNAVLFYSNLAKRYEEPSNVVARDANGYPTKISGPFSQVTGLAVLGGDDAGKGRGVYNLPNGYYTVLWDGDGVRPASNFYLYSPYGGFTVTEVTAQVGAAGYTGSTGNARVFNLQATGGNYSPSLMFQFTGVAQDPADGNYWVSLQNLRVYPPNPTDPTGMTPWGLTDTPPKFHPNWLYQLGQASSIRVMDQMGTNSNLVGSFNHLKAQSALSYAFPYNVTVPVSQVQSYSGDPYFDTTQWIVIHITTSVPHNLYDGAGISMSGLGTATLSNGNSMSLDQGVFGGLHVLSPTDLLVPIGFGTNSVTMTNVLNPTKGTIAYQIGSLTPLEDIVDQCNQAGTNLWFNVPTCATNDCIDSMARYIAANLAKGKKVRVEYANECWNDGFVTRVFCVTQTYKMTGTAGTTDPVPFYVQQAKNCHDRFIAAFTAAGRPATDVVRVLGSYIDSGLTARLCDVAKPLSMQFDEVATAPYFINQAATEPTLMPIADLMTVGQGLDLVELNLRYSDFFQAYSANHKAVLRSKGFGSVKVVHYEGSLQTLTPYSTMVNAYQTSHAMNRHPRMFNIILAGFLQGLQNAGSTLINIFVLGQSLTAFGGVPDEWTTWFGWKQQAGTGNPTLDPINVSDPEANDQVKSEVGGAMHVWSSLAAQASTPPPPSKKKLIPGRNGQIRATGFPHGANRPSR